MKMSSYVYIMYVVYEIYFLMATEFRYQNMLHYVQISFFSDDIADVMVCLQLD